MASPPPPLQTADGPAAARPTTDCDAPPGPTIVIGAVAARLKAVAGELAAVTSDLDPATLVATEAVEVLAQFQAIARLANGGEIQVAQRAADAGFWRTNGDRSAADWLATKAGCGVRQARELLGASQKVAELPEVQAALGRGELSVDQALAVADGATADPNRERDLLDTARSRSLRELRNTVDKVKQDAITDEAAQQRAIHRARYLRRWLRDGAFNLSGRSTADAGVRVDAALAPFIEAVFEAARRSGVHEDLDAYAMDALVLAVEAGARWLDGIPPPTHPNPTTDPAARTPAATTPEASADPAPAGSSKRGTAGPAGRGGDAERAESPPPSLFPSSEPGWERVAPERSGPEPPPARGSAPPAPRPSGAGPPGSGPPGSGPPDQGPPGSGPPDQGPPGHPPPNASSSVTAPPGSGAPRDRTARLDELVAGGQLRPRGGRHIKVLVRVDAGALDRGHAVDGEVCEVAGYGPIPIPAARQLLADSALAVVLTHGTQVLSVANFSRAPSAIQTSVLQWRDRVCSVEGCTSAARLEADHIDLWSQDGPTSLDNLEYKCAFHHDLKTTQGWTEAPGPAGQDRPLLPPT